MAAGRPVRMTERFLRRLRAAMHAIEGLRARAPLVVLTGAGDGARGVVLGLDVERLRGELGLSNGGVGRRLIVRNDSGAAVARYGVMAVTGPSAAGETEQKVGGLRAVAGAVSGPADGAALAVVQWTVQAGAVVEAVASGLTWVKVAAGAQRAFARVPSSGGDALEMVEVGSHRVLTTSGGYALVDLGGGVQSYQGFRCQVSQSSGANGTTAPAAPTWTYDVVVNGQTLATALAPDVQQRPGVHDAAASFGLAYYKADGTVGLHSVGDVQAGSLCGAL